MEEGEEAGWRCLLGCWLLCLTVEKRFDARLCALAACSPYQLTIDVHSSQVRSPSLQPGSHTDTASAAAPTSGRSGGGNTAGSETILSPGSCRLAAVSEGAGCRWERRTWT